MTKLLLKKRHIGLFLLIFIINFLSACADITLPVENDNLPAVAAGDTMKVHFIDVGQGDAQLIQLNGLNTLIDTGEQSESSRLISYLKEQGVDKIDSLVLTHPHTDHMGGAVTLIKELEIGHIYMTNYIHTTKAYENLIKSIKENKIPRTQAKAGGTVDVGAGARALILAPGKDYKDINASSIVLRVVYGNTSFLFTGDATKETERDILSSNSALQSTVYKVSHHGSNTSNSADFLNAVSPSLSIIEVGKGNSYNHPHKEVMDQLEDMDTKILRTDLEGDILVTSDGKNIQYTASQQKNLLEAPASENKTIPLSMIYIGNKKSNVYHIDSCSNLPYEENRIYFETDKEAKQLGFHPCGRCIR